MYFYTQQVDIDKASGRHDVILDVRSVDDHLQLAQILDVSPLRDGLNANNQASMLRFAYFPSSYQESLKEGSWYDIDLKSFTGAQYQEVNPDAGGALLIRAVLVGVQNKINFAQFLSSPKIVNVPSSALDLVVQPNPKGTITLIVVNCGHGNWNEIVTKSDRVIYDVGASRLFTKSEVRRIVAGQRIANETRKISVVISHWDVDHYHALLSFEPAELKNLRAVFFPSQVPDTETYRRVLRILNNHGVVLSSVQPAKRTDSSTAINLEQHWHKGIFTLFRATAGRSRNQTGIVLGVCGPSEVALLTGDHHYNKILSAVQKLTSYSQRSCTLVTPHHGGNAGNISVNEWRKFFSVITTPISCGINSYGHPLSTIKVELNSMQAGANLIRTDMQGTWSKKL